MRGKGGENVLSLIIVVTNIFIFYYFLFRVEYVRSELNIKIWKVKIWVRFEFEEIFSKEKIKSRSDITLIIKNNFSFFCFRVVI